jgi:Fe-S-cluster containining protein
MRSESRLEEISDGKVYDVKDMVKADAGGCDGCSACCHGVGDLFSLSPYDIYMISINEKVTFEDLLNDKIELITEEKISLPHLKMYGDEDKCSFLNEEDRCSIHSSRPGVCRLFPLGRVYEDNDLKYFLQTGACTKPKLNKIKVKKWIGISNYKENKKFVLEWYKLIKALRFRLKFVRDEEELREINGYLIDVFYKTSASTDEEFYDYFHSNLANAKSKLGIL